MRTRILIYTILLIALDAIPAAAQAQQRNCTTTCYSSGTSQQCNTNCWGA